MALKIELELDVVIDGNSGPPCWCHRRNSSNGVPLELLEHHRLIGSVGIEQMSFRSVGPCPKSAVPEIIQHAPANANHYLRLSRWDLEGVL